MKIIEGFGAKKAKNQAPSKEALDKEVNTLLDEINAAWDTPNWDAKPRKFLVMAGCSLLVNLLARKTDGSMSEWDASIYNAEAAELIRSIACLLPEAKGAAQ